MRYLVALLLGFAFVGCQPAKQDIDASAIHPFIGCWENETGLEREGWTLDPSGWLIGYAASRDNEGNVTFFEHMRIERNNEAEILVVTGQDNSETRFIRRKIGEASEFRFENASHDYPQVIVYQRNGDVLSAYIDLMEGGRKVSFDKRVCKGT